MQASSNSSPRNDAPDATPTPPASPIDNRQLLRQVVLLALPILIGSGVQTCYHLINMFWVGRLGADAIAVVSISYPINLLIIALGTGLSLAASILISQYFGARDTASIDHVVAQSLLAVAVCALVLIVIGVIFAPDILHFMGVASSYVDDAIAYIRVSFFSTLFMFLSIWFQSILRGLGQAKAPLRIIMASVVINAALDPLLIFGAGPLPALGVTGAAWATLITQAITAVAGIRLMLRPAFGLHLAATALRPDPALIARLFRLGIPASIEQSVQALFLSVMTILVAKFGTIALAAYGVVFRVLTVTIIPSYSLCVAVAILVGQYKGAGEPQKSQQVARVTALFGFAAMSLVGLIFLLGARPVVGFFVPGDAQLLEHGTLALQIFALSFPLSAVQMVFTGVFRGAGATFSSMLLTLVGTWGIQLPLALALGYSPLGEAGLWWSGSVAALINTTIALLYFRTGRWDRAKLVAA